MTLSRTIKSRIEKRKENIKIGTKQSKIIRKFRIETTHIGITSGDMQLLNIDIYREQRRK